VAGFCDPPLKNSTKVFTLHDVESCVIDNIRRLFKHELSVLACQCSRIAGWPTDEQLGSLHRMAAGFLVLAVVTVNFPDHKFQDPLDQLDLIARSPGSAVHEGETKLGVHTSLDSLRVYVSATPSWKLPGSQPSMARAYRNTPSCAIVYACVDRPPPIINYLIYTNNE